MYNQLFSLGLLKIPQLYNLQLFLQILAVISISLAKVHLHTTHQSIHSLTYNLLHHRLFFVIFDASQLRFNFHIASLISFSTLLWCGHLVHVAIPASRGGQSSLTIYPFFNFHWSLYSTHNDPENHIFDSHINAGQAILTNSTQIKQDTYSLNLSDIAHHHFALAVLLLVASNMYQSTYKGFGHKTRDILNVKQDVFISTHLTSLHLQLSLACAFLSFWCEAVAQHIYSLTPYLYLSYDYVSTGTHYTHHSWIASFLVLASFAHIAIFLIRDYTPTKDVIFLLISQKASILSHLSQVCLWLGFHTLGVYIHNDTVVAFANPKMQILIEPVFAQSINPSSLHQGPGDLLAHHALACGFHVSTLIVLKGSLDARGSTLMPDKIHVGYGFACDGPGRGGTCDISAWDSLYLATFWMLNSIAWFLFYFHWKHLTLWQNTVFQFDESSTYLNGWFRDYLWFNSTPLIHGYDAFGANNISIWAWSFLAAHLCWATGFMFLISWRGYWQELIDIILYMHLKTPILYNLWNNTVYTPVALSIVQARFLGVVHFSAGFILTYAAFITGTTNHCSYSFSWKISPINLYRRYIHLAGRYIQHLDA